MSDKEMMSIPALGSKVNFIRATDVGEVFEGEGILRTVFIDPNNRLMAQVKESKIEGDTTYNVDFICLNAPEDFKEEYEKLIRDVKLVTDEGNALVKKTVSEYNNRVQRLYDAVIGKAIA